MHRTRTVWWLKVVAVALFLSVAAALVVYMFQRGRRDEPPAYKPKLEGRVVAVFNNTRYAHESEGRIRFVLTAATDRTYEDGSHELEQVRLESFGSDGSRSDVVTADRAAVSDPADLTRLDVDFLGNVFVQTSDGLAVKTASLHYDYQNNTVDTPDLVEFESPRMKGRTTGLRIEANLERVHLLRDTDVTVKPSGTTAAPMPGTERARRQLTPDERAARKARKKARKAARERIAREPGRRGKPPTSKPLAESGPVRIQCEMAVWDGKQFQLSLAGRAIVTRGEDEMRADRMIAFFDSGHRFDRIEARGNSLLRQGDRLEITSLDMDFDFGEGQSLESARAIGGAHAKSLGPGSAREARAHTLEARFAAAPSEGALENLTGVGEAWIKLHADPPVRDTDNPTERELAAATISADFYPDGRSIRFAEATEGATLSVTPVRAEKGAEKKVIRAPRMTSEFYESGNRLRTFNATGGVTVEFQPLIPDAGVVRTSRSRELMASFDADTQEVVELRQQGDFRYVESDRNATAALALYDNRREILSLRGGRPTMWDSKARTQATEIDYDRPAAQILARGDVRTTYYSGETTGGSTPFENSKSPVFVTADRAEAEDRTGVAVYTGNARGWQDDNFVKADRIELFKEEKRMIATGNVDSALYTVKRDYEGGEERVPGLASAERMIYSDAERTIQYTGSVRARQGTDTLQGRDVLVFLREETNDVDRMIAEGSVVLTQPGRRGRGDRLVYSADDGKAVLTGRNARVDDDEKGAIIGSELTLLTLDDRITAVQDEGTGRVRSVHRLSKGKKN